MKQGSSKNSAVPFGVGCNLYTEKNYDEGFAAAFSFLSSYKKFIDNDEYRKMKRYLRRKQVNAKHHFKEEPFYLGANLLGMIPDKKFVSIDAWLTKGVTGRKKVTQVEIYADCMIMCKCGHCLTRQEAKGTDPFIMKPKDFERKALEIRQTWRH